MQYVKNSAHFLRYLMLYSYLSKKPWHMFHTVWLLMRSSPARHTCATKLPAMLHVASDCKDTHFVFVCADSG